MRGSVVLYNYTINLLEINIFIKSYKNIENCFGCIEVSHSIISLPDEFGKIKRVIIMDNYFFSLSYLINNKNQEIFTICDFKIMSYNYQFVQIINFEAISFDLTYFKTKDFDILSYNFTDFKANYENSNNFKNFIYKSFLLSLILFVHFQINTS